MHSKPRYITTTLPYVNADPHIGFALEIVQADVLARAWRGQGRDVFFSTGTDEHGQKIYQKANEDSKDVQEYVDYYAGRFNDSLKKLNISYDNFIRTTDEHHLHAAQEMWRRCAEKGDIYKKKYTGLYCVGCEMYVKDNDLVNGECPNHAGKKPEEIEEENYFFALSKYQDKLLKYLEQDGVIVPEWRREEAIAFVKNGLEDFSISREKERMSWGVPVPGDDDQVMYVWFDALTNYISTLGWPCCEGEGVHEKGCNFKKFWEDGSSLQAAGKDQVRFQSIMWQAMLMSAGVPRTDEIFYHGFITSGGQKMSKSIGNVISPFELIDKYGTDATRYILLRHVHPVDDADVTWEKMDEWYNANLANGLGNLVARVMKMAEMHLPKQSLLQKIKNLVPRPDVTSANLPIEFIEAIESFEFNKAADIIWEKIGELDARIQKDEPFKLIKIDKDAAVKIIKELVEGLAEIAVLLEPIMPDTSTKVMKAIAENKKPETLFERM